MRAPQLWCLTRCRRGWGPTRIVDEHIDGAEPPLDRRDMAIDQGQIGQVPGERQPLRARHGDVLQGGLEGLGLDVADSDACALLSKRFGDRAPKAAARAENESRFATYAGTPPTPLMSRAS